MIKPILSLIIILFSAGFGFFYVKPEYDQVQGTRADLQKLDQTSQSAGEIKNIIAETGKSLNALDPQDLARFDVFLPETLDGIRFANNLQHIGVANGLIISDIKVEEPDKQKKSANTSLSTVSATIKTSNAATSGAAGSAGAGGEYVATKASFTLTATYQEFLLFLNDLEKSLGLINITSLSFKEAPAALDEKGAAPKGLPMLYQFSVDIETYSLK